MWNGSKWQDPQAQLPQRHSKDDREQGAELERLEEADHKAATPVLTKLASIISLSYYDYFYLKIIHHDAYRFF